MKTNLHTLAIAVIGFALIGSAHANNGAASKDTAAKTNAAAAIQTDQGIFAQFSQTNTTTFAATIEDNGIASLTHWTRNTDQLNVGATKTEDGFTLANTKMADVKDTGNVVNTGGLNGTTNNTTQTATTNTGGTAQANAHHLRGLFVGTVQGVEIHCSWACRKIHP